MKRLLLTTLASAVILVFANAQDPREIVRKSNDLMRGQSTYSEISMTVVKPEWTRTVRMKAWALEPDYALVYVTEPARDRGNVTLKRRNEVWNWLPAVQRVIKIPPSMMLQSWMGSDFTNDDLVRQSSIVEDYTHVLVGQDTTEGTPCWKIELVPRPEAGVVWGRLLMWIAQEGYQQLRTEFYDDDDARVRVFTGSTLRNFDGRMLPSLYEIQPETEPGKKTILEYHEVRFRQRLEPSFFSEQNMKRVR